MRFRNLFTITFNLQNRFQEMVIRRQESIGVQHMLGVNKEFLD